MKRLLVHVNPSGRLLAKASKQEPLAGRRVRGDFEGYGYDHELGLGPHRPHVTVLLYESYRQHVGQVVAKTVRKQPKGATFLHLMRRFLSL